MTREQARVDEWAKALAPSPQLRAWFSHLPERFDGFRRSYIEELIQRQEQVEELRARTREGTVTLLFAARNRERNNAVVLAELLRDGASPSAPSRPSSRVFPILDE